MAMSKTRIMPLAFSSALILIATSLLFAAFPVANASTSTTVSGTLSQGSLEILSIRIDNSGNTVIQVNRTDILTGGIVGTCTDIIPTTIIIHADGLTGNIHGKCQGRATILGRTGTYVESFSATFNGNGVVVGHASLGDGTGGLAGMHGVQTDSSPDGITTYYSAQIHFEES